VYKYGARARARARACVCVCVCVCVDALVECKVFACEAIIRTVADLWLMSDTMTGLEVKPLAVPTSPGVCRTVHRQEF